ncbi:MAG TPA: sterol desaturase family protein [Beijerinckiaceae bacterium]|nr:sterol desaturase family protein [Beijerinckiaceae bacterium]
MEFLTTRLENFLNVAWTVFISIGSTFSLTSLACAFLVSAGYVAWRRHSRGRAVKLRTVLAGMFPKRIWRGASMTADLWLFFLNAFVMGAIVGWAVLSFHFLGGWITDGLNAAFGPRAPTAMPEWMARALFTLVLFLAYEFGYWLEHWISHRVPFLWEFHKVHHSAEHLTPLTVWRMHPVNTVLFANVVGVVLAIAGSVAAWLLGGPLTEYAYSGTNVILIVFVHLYLHLQHSHIWISFTGWAGRIFMSPAHHQIHHSTNPLHFDRNMGSCLSLFDWLFGTLHVPARQPEKLSFGIEAEGDVNTITATLVTPFVDSGRQLAKLATGGSANQEPVPHPRSDAPLSST